jgi:hypothetical protein
MDDKITHNIFPDDFNLLDDDKKVFKLFFFDA